MTTSADRLSTRFISKGAALTLASTLALGAAVGCSSQDSRVFRSTQFQPISVALVDQTSSETVWSYDIPVSHQLKVNLDSGGAENRFANYNSDNPRSLKFQLQGPSSESGRVDLPGNEMQWVVAVRPTPETVSPGQVMTPEAEESLSTPELDGLDLEPLELEPSETEPLMIEPVEVDPIEIEPIELEASAIEPLPAPVVPDADPITDPALVDDVDDAIGGAADVVEEAIEDAVDNAGSDGSILGPGN